ncbi:MAG: hypothetical protein AB1306_02400 [Nitrospirota bacterium]
MRSQKSIITVLVCFFFLFTSCTANIKREGYQLDNSVASEKECSNIIVVKNLNYNPELVDIAGKISASDTGFSVKCSETFVVDNFKKDACEIGADIINITKDSQPDFWSTCYRAEAEYIRVKNREMLSEIKTDAKYSAQNISNRSKYTECMNKGIVAAGALGGLIGGLILSGICKSGDTENNQSVSSSNNNIENNK